MNKFRKIWNEELNNYLLENKAVHPKEGYELFLKKYPKIKDVSYCAYKNQRCRIGASYCSRPHGTTKSRPLYSEHLKKGYVKIKVAQPNVWMMKSKWVYLETHPWEYELVMNERANYIFLDGNNRNFSPDNIERVPLDIMGIFNNLGGTVEGNAEATRLRVLQVKMKKAMLDTGEKAGLVVNEGHCRRFKDERNRKAREYQSRPEVKLRRAERRKERRKV